MKKLIAIVLVLVMALSLVACGGAEQPKEKAVKVGIAAPDVPHGWVAGVAYYAEKYCKDNGLEYKVSTSGDAAEMQAGLQDLVAWGATVIVSFPQWEGMETAMQEIIDSGIPIVNFDIDVACKNIYKVTGDNYDMGYQSAKYIVEKAGEAAHIAVLDVPSSGSVCELRKQGFYDYLAEINYDTSNIQEFQLESFARDDGLKNAADILEKMPQVDAFYSMDDETSIGTILAMKEANRMECKAITGGGGCQEYFKIIASDEGKAIGAASALYSPAMIQDAIKVAIKVLNGEAAEPVLVIPTTIVNAENVADHLDPSNNVY
jgi:ribose transport system substrate-binding protein